MVIYCQFNVFESLGQFGPIELMAKFGAQVGHLALGADGHPPWPLLASFDLGQNGPNWSHCTQTAAHGYEPWALDYVLWAIEGIGGLKGPKPPNQRGWARGQEPRAQNQKNWPGGW
ncbi:hypothetical protein O181_005903 [Austropuccinia psidii MF-1]|uniref:Uncharacterized protein n=1 Tax=Austropuccinia psidii MF-1 TaxID=1389203 RepID=A0A9Q3BJ59_9BASI|nr:hypothetical protein [Austropuccinia psidii MF-1]